MIFDLLKIQNRSEFANLRPNLWLAIGLFCCLLTNTGCSSLTTTKQWNWPWESKDKEPQIPDRILPIWTDTIMHQPGKPGIRGFGGRIYFYAGEDTQAIEVDGGLVIYVFDSDKMDPHSPSPEKKYVFTPEHMKNHMSEAPLGKSYSIWLPWDEVGGESRSLTLVTRFEGTKGGVILSQPAVKFLPGVGKKEDIAPSTTQDGNKIASGTSPVQQAGYQGDGDKIRWTDPANKGSTKESSRRRETQTIDLPPSFYRHLNSPKGSPLSDPFQDQTPQSPSAAATENAADGTTIVNPTSASANATTSKEITTVGNDERPPPSNALLRYPFRHIPGSEATSTTGSMETTVSHTRPNRREPLKGGWIESLPKTPRTP